MRLFTAPTAPSKAGAELDSAWGRAAPRCCTTVESTASVPSKRSVAPHVDANVTTSLSLPLALCATTCLLCCCDPPPLCRSFRRVCVAHSGVWRGLWRLLGRGARAAPRCAIARPRRLPRADRRTASTGWRDAPARAALRVHRQRAPLACLGRARNAVADPPMASGVMSVESNELWSTWARLRSINQNENETKIVSSPHHVTVLRPALDPPLPRQWCPALRPRSPYTKQPITPPPHYFC